jgi:hypothetical protein
VSLFWIHASIVAIDGAISKLYYNPIKTEKIKRTKGMMLKRPKKKYPVLGNLYPITFEFIKVKRGILIANINNNIIGVILKKNTKQSHELNNMPYSNNNN